MESILAFVLVLLLITSPLWIPDIFRLFTRNRFLVITTANSADSTVPHLVPRLITAEFRKALRIARNIQKFEGSAFLSHIMIYKLKAGRTYKMEDLQGPMTAEHPLVFASWPVFGKKSWRESFRKDFVSYA
jgi:hypothetical protein